jgi:hypothetical protein
MAGVDKVAASHQLRVASSSRAVAVESLHNQREMLRAEGPLSVRILSGGKR